MYHLLFILNQIPLKSHPFFYLFIGVSIILAVITLIMMMVYRRKNSEMKLTHQQHTAKVDSIRREQVETMEKIRVEMLKREEERSRQWMESEKETLHVLNGVSILLDLSEKIGKVESDKILKKLEELQLKVEKLTEPE